jgi:hypothetical protein
MIAIGNIKEVLNAIEKVEELSEIITINEEEFFDF